MTVPKIMQFGSTAFGRKGDLEKLLNRRGDFTQLPSPHRNTFDQQAVFYFRAPQRLVTLLPDISSSMLGKPIEQVNCGAADFTVDCCEDVLTRDSLQVQIVTFGGHVHVYPFVPIAQFTPPTFRATGDTPMAEAILTAVAETDRYREFLQGIQVEAIRPQYYFLFSDGQPNPSSLLEEAATCIRRYERDRQGAFYGFGVDQAAVAALQPFFVREVQLLSKKNFAEFFRIVSVSVRYIS
jgi:uncharacterized protein YegL